jgi:hypothetical protein
MKKLSDRIGKVAVIEWEDSWGNNTPSEYYTVEEVQGSEPLIGLACGIVIRDNKDGITITQQVWGKKCRIVHHIPRAMIRKVWMMGQRRWVK